MRAIDKIEVELSVVLGRTSMPIQQLLRLGRGAVIMLDDTGKDEVEVVVNNAEFASGQVVVKDQQICVEILEPGKHGSEHL
jgi:flagellar motor switch protein FliN/FliY